ncbi:MAG: glycosyltransferase [Actinomycetes bacterium]
MTEVSVIIPVRDAAATIGETLESVLAQRCDLEWEVVVVDNGSTDATRRIVDAVAAEHPRLRTVTAFDATGPSHARRVGIAATSSARLVFCDGDDVVVPGWLAALSGALDDDEVATGPLDTTVLNPPWLAASRGVYPKDRPLTWHGCFPVASFGNVAMRRSTYERIGPFDETYTTSEDHEYSLRLAVAGVEIRFVPEAVVHYRMRGAPRDLWRQGLAYGTSRPRLRREVARAGMRPPGRFAGWRSWVRLLTLLPGLRTEAGRAQWCWIAGVRMGHLRGSVRARTVFL